MAKTILWCVSVSLFLIFNSAWADSEIVVHRNTGHYPSPDQSCSADIGIAEYGGFKVLTFRSGSSELILKVADATGMSWISPQTAVFSVSPIYGKPGIFSLDCKSGKLGSLSTPLHFSEAYPSGADYFELLRVTSDGKIFFYYSHDVDKTDFERFRSRKNLREITFRVGQ
jgi:hypothetical protein